jgi:hypothetical protein
MLSAIVIPAEDRQPLRLEQFGVNDLDARQRLVGGYIEVIRLERPTAVLYVNEDGRLLELPANRRATVLLWVHNRAFRGHDVILGDAFILGPPDDNGNATTAPQELVNLLFHTERYRVLIQNQGEEQFYGTLRILGSWIEAYRYGVDLAGRLSQVEEIQVVAEDGNDLETEAEEP